MLSCIELPKALIPPLCNARTPARVNFRVARDNKGFIECGKHLCKVALLPDGRVHNKFERRIETYKLLISGQKNVQGYVRGAVNQSAFLDTSFLNDYTSSSALSRII